MKILVLTSVNPLLATDPYITVANHFEKNKENNQAKIDMFCYPFFSEVAARENNQEYLPTLFSMMSSAIEPEMKRKLFKRDNVVVFGNSYKDQEFDIVVSFDDMHSEVFDSYLETIRVEETMQDFAELINLDNLYKYEDAEFHFVNIDHLILFLKEAYYGKNKIK